MYNIQEPGVKRKAKPDLDHADRKKKSLEDLAFSYLELSKVYSMYETRTDNPDYIMLQEDYHEIDVVLINTHTDKYPTKEYGIIKMGLSQGGIWVACKDKEGEQFALTEIPKITPPEVKVKGVVVRPLDAFKYVVYGPDNKPYKYYKARIPARLWTSHERLIVLLKHFNKDLDYIYKPDQPQAFFRNAHMRISSGMVDEKKEVKGGYFMVTIEADDNMTPKLAKLGGILRIGANMIKLIGGGIDKAVVNYVEPVPVQPGEHAEMQGVEEASDFDVSA